MRITPNDAGLGARIEGIGLAQDLSPDDLRTVPRALGQHGLLRFPGHDLDHAGGPRPEAPRIFLGPAASAVGPDAAVRMPPSVRKQDWQAELGVVIRRRAGDVSEGVAPDHVVGHTVPDDISADEFGFDMPLAMTSFARRMVGFRPMRPCIATADEVGEPWALDIRCRMNREDVQHGKTRDPILPVATPIAFLSRCMTLEPGDVIATGTPAGVGHVRDPPRRLGPGNRLRMEVERVGFLGRSIA
jgi:2-keto-4-pentenoate hydratase/2-oxohepta-3-ene-1,7-dioic acid hydratase in catechol pathway